jgi:biopolymer transport protein ExbD
MHGKHTVLRRRVLLVVCALAAALALLAGGGCRSTAPALTMRHFSKNIVIAKDQTVFIEKDRSTPAKLAADLRAHGLSDNTYITIHVHERVSPEFFDRLVKTLKDEGFKNLDYVVYGD